MGIDPLRGAAVPGLPRFVDLSRTYDEGLRKLLRRAGQQCGLKTRSGVYLAVSGPSYETPAEIRAFARLGADAVGMSTVPEADRGPAVRPQGRRALLYHQPGRRLRLQDLVAHGGAGDG